MTDRPLQEMSPFVLGGLRRDLEMQLRRIVRSAESRIGEPVSVEVCFVEPAASDGDLELCRRIEAAVRSFHERTLVRRSGLRVQRVATLSCEGTDRKVLRVRWAYGS